MQEVMPAPKKQDYEKISEKFWSKWNYPNCIGAVDGKHVRIRAPAKSGSDYFNYKHFHSIVLMAVADAEYKFIMVDIGAKGSQADGGILKNSTFGQMLYNGTLDLPLPRPLPFSSIISPFVFLGDQAFPLKENLIRPYPRTKTAKSERIFNYRLSRARRVVENSFGMLAARWRILLNMIEADLDLVDLIVQTAVVLHNFLQIEKDYGDLTVDLEDSTGNLRVGNWREIVGNDRGMVPLEQCSSNNFTQNASQVRKNFENYFMSSQGRVNWQDHLN